MKKQIIVVSVTLGLFIINIQVQAQHHEGHKGKKMEETIKGQADPAFQSQLEKVYKASLDLNDAFVASDVDKVKRAVAPVQEAISKVDMKLVKDKAHRDWMHYLNDLNTNLAQIKSIDKISEQRKYFAAFNDALYKSIKEFGIGGETVYYQHCPMALDNSGANWLSNSKEIRNPYFGDKMLKCGSVKETL